MIRLLLAALLTLTLGAADIAQSQRAPLRIVTVDRAKLSANQRVDFEQYLRTADIPPTQSRNYCRYFEKPQAWCLYLDKPVADRLFQDLSRRFGSAASIEVVNRLR
ncbi:MAG: hypothetical protein DCF22_00735 [Leptolyngbya sp.]|nr:MAG: hypothetical protein DCF22_00735 [Leptolyngbya sp.]